MRVMKIKKLSLEEIEQPSSNAPVQTDALEVSSTAEEVESTSEENTEQAEALEARYLVLEGMLQDWLKAGKLTPKMLHQTHEALPELGIVNGVKTHEARYTLALEGILAQFTITFNQMSEEDQREHQKDFNKMLDDQVAMVTRYKATM
jgi:hypothetical protein